MKGIPAQLLFDVDSNSGPSCPSCGSPMRIRTARSGRNAGGQFYGCSRYPDCRGTRPFVEDEKVSLRTCAIPHDTPVRVPVLALGTSTEAELFECIAVPRDALSSAISEDMPWPHLRALCQWQLDRPRTRAGVVGTTFVSVVGKLLMRGKTIPLSPFCESALRNLVKIQESEEEEWSTALQESACSSRPTPTWESGFDSDEEEVFVQQLLPSIAGSHILGWIQRQVHLESLADVGGQNHTDRRVDFLITHPTGLQIVIEIDGAQHQQHEEADCRRDSLLVAAGYEVIRIPASEVRNGNGKSLTKLRDRLATINDYDASSKESKLLLLVRRAHQIQLALWRSLDMGIVPLGAESPVLVHVRTDWEFDESITAAFVDAVLADLNSVISDVASLYGEEDKRATFQRSETPEITVQFVPEYTKNASYTLVIRDIYLPLTVATIAPENSDSTPANAVEAPEATCERLLNRVFGFQSLREGQYEAISRGLTGKDAIVLLPTGAGKSVAFQLTALLRPGVCIVVDPIISLMEDQIENLRAYGIDRACHITSDTETVHRETILESIGRGEHLFCYVTPERFQSKRFRDSLLTLTESTSISLVCIDEAHCVSEWGHDFRPAYLNIARTSRRYCSRDRTIPPLMALTGTASRAVLKDVQRELEIEDFEAIITPRTFDRPELHFRTISCRSNEKMPRLKGVLESLPKLFGHTPVSFFEPCGRHTRSGLIFCPHVNGDYGVVRISDKLSNSLGRSFHYYSGTQPKGSDENSWYKKKKQTARDFKQNHFALMICTKAFGMGIDKPNIRYTVHYGLPPSIEAFYQEAGRAGRDKQDAQCLLLYSNDMPERTRELLNPSLSADILKRQIDDVSWGDADDITRVLWFHTNSFVGNDVDYSSTLWVIDQIGDLSRARDVTIAFSKENRESKEKAIHRLLTLGVVVDYTIEYSAQQFCVSLSGLKNIQIKDQLYRYIAAYQRGQAEIAIQRVSNYLNLPHDEFVKIAAKELIQFVYEIIERSRRQALSEILALCEQCRDDDAIRQRLVTYLGTSGFTTQIDGILDADDGGMDKALAILENIRSTIDASQLRGESGRALESYPDNPGLRLLRGGSEAMVTEPSFDVARENVEAAVQFSQKKYGIELRETAAYVVAAIRLAADARPELSEPLVDGLLRGAVDRRHASRIVVAELPLEMIWPALNSLVTDLNMKLITLLEVTHHGD